jgi:hypothetical protein
MEQNDVIDLVKREFEKMHQEFLDRNCNDLLVILCGHIQIALLENWNKN